MGKHKTTKHKKCKIWQKKIKMTHRKMLVAKLSLNSTQFQFRLRLALFPPWYSHPATHPSGQVVIILCKDCLNQILILGLIQVYFKTTLRLDWDCCNITSRLLQNYFKITSSVFKTTSRLLQDYFKTISSLLQDYFKKDSLKKMSRIRWGYSNNTSKVLQDYLKALL